ncbi:MAG: ribosomal protein S18-alanine N-acetyltransferase [Chloroflexi bacterium]|jgi:[ribosomal protein S18]-alanine N-acetyltransferase|nr:ribosomal protein S18-alanine N-acetyltransferase [Chloroflexota bacterium]MBT7081250.1 ribosomal protein S18-alanine N-acetyltransferase [Chloroflexota bacterium]MBT7288915.1 ribosomal protein S18-alanine N-acetyltransferase [Chloroflexota bacterium]
MNYYIRPMQAADINQVKEIDLEAFPTLKNGTSFKNELRNDIARYFVIYQEDNTNGDKHDQTPHNSLITRVKEFLVGPAPTKDHIAGFAGMWFMADEAHLITIAVRKSQQGLGLGQSLLMAVINTALRSKASMVTLEVRASNLAAQSLYAKYGFKETGYRKNYYSDTKENALIMTADDIYSQQFTDNLGQLKKELDDKIAIILEHLF